MAEAESLKSVAPGPYLCGESPMWDPATQTLVWTDMLAGTLHRYDPADGSVTQIAEGKNVSGLTLNKSGGLVCATHQGVCLWDEEHGFRLIADAFEGHALQCNDATADSRGRFLFGSAFYGPGLGEGEYPLGKLFKLEDGGRLTVLDENIHLTNGLAFSPDDRTLYYTDTVLRVIYAYDYDIENGTVGNRREFVKVPDHEGIPDGLTVDAEGYLWSAQWYGGCVVRYDPSGKVDRYLRTPMLQTSAVVFGGAALDQLFITTASLGVKLHVAPAGYDFDAPNIGGPLYVCETGSRGREERVADITIA